LNPFEKGFFRACLIYTKINGVIINRTVLDMLRRVVELLTVTPHKEALKIGFEKVKNLIKNTALKGMFQKMLEWVASLEYIIYLGFMELNKPEYLRFTKSCMPKDSK